MKENKRLLAEVKNLEENITKLKEEQSRLQV
jgi:hypothetical protein